MVRNMYIIKNNLGLVINSDGPNYRRLCTNIFVSFVFSTFEFVSLDVLIFCTNVFFFYYYLKKDNVSCGVVSDTVQQEIKPSVSRRNL